MANLILPRRLQNQPQGRQRLNLDCGVPWGNDTEIFLAGATPGVHLVGTEQQPRRVGSLSLQYQNLNGLNTAYTTSTSGGTVSAKVIVPPSSLSIFAVMASRIDWRDATANNFVGGFTKSGTSSGGITAAYGGDAAMGLAFGTDEPVTPFRGVPAGLALTYSDGTSEMIRTGFDGIAKNNRDTWFVGVSFKDASEYVTFAKNLRTGESFSSVTATTKSLKQVEQPFQAFCSLPFLSTTWARNCSQAGVYVGYSGAAFDVDTFGRMAQDPWQIFRAKPRVLYFDVAGGGGTTHNLEAAAAAQAAASAALSVSVPLAAAGIAVATATGAMSVSIPLAGSAQAVASASGDLSVTGNASLAGNATATANATGGMSLSIPLSGPAIAQAMAQAGLSQGVTLAGSAAAVSDSSGDISLNVSLSGAALAAAASGADLSSVNASSMSGAAYATSSAAGGITQSIPLSGASVVVSDASGALSQIVPITGSAASAASVTGGLDVTISLGASALAYALASADLTSAGGLSGAASGAATATGTISLHINMDGAAIAEAIASGVLTAAGLLVDHTPGWVIAANARDWVIAANARDWRISA